MTNALRLVRRKVLPYAVLSLVCIVTLYPVVWMFYTSLKSNQEIVADSFSLPGGLHFENFLKAWKTAKMNLYFLNSVFVSVLSTIMTVLVGACAAFILAKFKFKSRPFVMTLFVIGMLIPMQAILVPLFIQMKSLRLVNTLASLVFSYTAFGLPLAIYVLESYIRGLPDSVLEAAVLDGAPLRRILFAVIMPMAGPAISTVAIVSFLNNWKEFSLALVFISADSKKTLPLGLYNFFGAYSTDYAQLMAAMVIASIPLIAMYMALQELIIRGMAEGAVKS